MYNRCVSCDCVISLCAATSIKEVPPSTSETGDETGEDDEPWEAEDDETEELQWVIGLRAWF